MGAKHTIALWKVIWSGSGTLSWWDEMLPQVQRVFRWNRRSNGIYTNLQMYSRVLYSHLFLISCYCPYGNNLWNLDQKQHLSSYYGLQVPLRTSHFVHFVNKKQWSCFCPVREGVVISQYWYVRGGCPIFRDREKNRGNLWTKFWKTVIFRDMVTFEK